MTQSKSKQKKSAPPAPAGEGKKLSVIEAIRLASSQFQAGELQKAEALLRKILEYAPGFAPAIHLLGIISHQSGKTEVGTSLVRQAVELAPKDAQFRANLAEIYRLQKKLDEAVAEGEMAVTLGPRNAAAHSNLGIAYYDQGDFERAEACQRRALTLDPKMPSALNNMGSILREKKDRAGAIEYYRKVLAVAPGHLESISNLGSVLTDNDQPDEALKLLLPLIKAHPDYAEAHCNIANAFLALEDLDKALFGFRRALELKPEHIEALMGLARTLQEKRQLREALEVAERALALTPGKAGVHSLLGAIYSESGFPQKAEEAYRKALEIDPDLTSAYLGRGQLRMDNGDLSGAEADFRHTLTLDKENLGGRLALAQVGKVKPDDQNMAELIAEAEKLDTMPETKALPLHFGLGKCYEDTKQYDLAFHHYQEGCRLKRKRIQYSADNTELAGKNIRQFFSRENIDRLRGAACSSDLPIFVLGMPRSGTTLTETILASHPQVYGAGELNDIIEIANSPRGPIEETGYPLVLQGVTQAELKIMGERYVAGLQQRAPNSPRITDKMPANFNCLGLIHLMLPNAKIVHVKRNPVDTCLSCYTRLFNKSQYHSYDLTDIGRYYRNYALMMEHWRNVLPAGSFYEIQYEDLVADQEAQARSMLEYCGLEWDDACIDFHKTERNIRTASVTQVRQPIYKTSVEKWRHYEQHLGPLLETLGDLVER